MYAQVGADADEARVGCVTFAPKGFGALARLFEGPRAVAERHAAEMVQVIEY